MTTTTTTATDYRTYARRKLAEEMARIGGLLEIESSCGQIDVRTTAPDGMVFKASQTHFIDMSGFTGAGATDYICDQIYPTCAGQVMQRILEDFRGLGYDVDYRLFNVADFGVPQSRWRVIILGTRRMRPSIQLARFPQPTHAGLRVDGELLPWVSIGEALDGIPEPTVADHRLSNHVCSKYKVTNRNFTGHRRTDPDKPSPTILARGNGKGGVCALQHPGNHRRLTVRESAIIQTFPMDFRFFGALNSMYRQVGNAVPVLFAERLGQQFGRTVRQA